MNKFNSIEKICEKIFYLEKEYDLLDYDIYGVKIWQLMRMPLYYDIAVALGVLSPPHPGLEKRSRTLLKFASLGNLFFRNPMLTRGSVDTLVLPHPRKITDNGKWIDVHTHYLIQQLEDQGQRCVLLEKTGRGLRSGRLERTSLRADIFLWLNRLNVFLNKANCSKKELHSIIKLERLLNNSFGLSIDITTKLSTQLQLFRLDCQCYRMLLNRLQPKTIYVVVGYCVWGALIKVAKELGIKVIEIQHGVFSRYHLGYSYPDQSTALDYFPDKLATWGRYWSEIEELPLPKSAIVDYGFKYFRHKQKQFVGTGKRKNQILVISQGSVSDRLAEIMSDLAVQLQDYRIVYKLHPNEYSMWRQQEVLCRLAGRPNFTIASENSDIYRLFAESEYQFGVFSTAIFEGVGMGCKTVLFDLPGIEYMQKMINKGYCIKFTENTNILNTMAIADKIDTTTAAEQLFGE